MKLLILHVSEHRDENLVRPIWNRLFEDGESTISLCLAMCSVSYPPAALEPDADAQTNADRIIAKVVPLGQRFYPSESAFPLREYLFRKYMQIPTISFFHCRAYFNTDCTICLKPQRRYSIWLGTADIGSMWGSLCRDLGCLPRDVRIPSMWLLCRCLSLLIFLIIPPTDPAIQ
jgi:hypothetical protein